MTKVLCDFRKCVYNQNKVCTKEIINLDERVKNIFVGCPDAEWEAEVDDNSAFEEYKDEVRKEYEYLHWDIR